MAFEITSYDPAQLPLSGQACQRVRELLAKWHVTDAEKVFYNPKYDRLSVDLPVFARPLMECLVITDGGTRAHNHWQLDGFDCQMTLRTEDSSEEEEEKEKRPLWRSPRSRRQTARFDAPYKRAGKRKK